MGPTTKRALGFAGAMLSILLGFSFSWGRNASISEETGLALGIIGTLGLGIAFACSDHEKKFGGLAIAVVLIGYFLGGIYYF